MKIPPEIKEFCEGPKLGFIVTDGPEGLNVTPKGSLAYHDEEHLIYGDRFSNKTLRNLDKNKRVAVFIINRDLNKGYQFKGTAELIDKGPLLDEMNDLPMVREGKIPAAKYAVKIKVDKIYDQTPRIGR